MRCVCLPFVINHRGYGNVVHIDANVVIGGSVPSQRPVYTQSRLCSKPGNILLDHVELPVGVLELLCHETTTRAARLEQGFLVTLLRPASNVRVFQGYRHDTLEGSATPLPMKGRTGFVHDEAWWE